MLLEVERLSKSYPGVKALSEVSFSMARGEVHALLGVNGAGKSTLIKILAGAVRRDAGKIVLGGDEVFLTNSREADQQGIACVYQEPALVPHLTIEQNLFLGRERTSRFGFISRSEQLAAAAACLHPIAPHLHVARLAGSLRASERQLVAIAKALIRKPLLVIMDEPTASMTEAESQSLFATILKLTSAGTGVLYVTHRIPEVYQIAQRITVLRDGQKVMTASTASVSRAQLVEAIVGRDVQVIARSQERPAVGRTLLTCSNLAKNGVFADVSFTIKAGEVVALAGLVGAGRSEIARVIFRADRMDRGEVSYPRGGCNTRDPAAALRAGVAMVPEDRKRQGIIPRMSVADNLLLSSLRRLSSRVLGLRRVSECRRIVSRDMGLLKLRPQGAETRPIEVLSGGNQQKVIIARAVQSQADLLILDEPTAGVDIETKAEIHRLIRQLAQDGRGILLISSEMEEVLALADRILVIRAGRLVREFEGRTASTTDVLRSAFETGAQTAYVA